MGEQDNKRVAIDFIERFSAGNLDHAHELLSEDLVWEVAGNPPISGTFGKKEFRANNLKILDTFVAWPKWIVDSAIVEGEKVAILSHSAADTPGGFQYRNKFMMLCTVRDGKILHVIEYMDTQHVAELLEAASAEAQASA
ncbi:hypothetical protein Sphch_1886 [Sphingobium chlorophenolicum L-1]|uniref:SnoaL-like domain-containing protein n=1 Tax=Sphingobium chlorophenolicum L-1 TaxID=690566 RepID=F6EUB3_SPHCR|nr:nuclear transport factor 2 family protein [Sphingobium chlorophenolicum]AEG49566.1 hypothetical protein Sphch_1886 [Sphingobium chlorophenolicum L-1]